MSDTVDLLVILDRSGSMERARADHEGGLRSFIRDQRDLDGDVRLTLAQFDTENPCELVFDRAPIADVDEAGIRLIPRGGTPLLDAIGKAVAHLRAKQPSRVIAMVITDGEENSSREWTKPRIREAVAECEKAGWTFLFLGADIDAFAEAGAVGFAAAYTANFSNMAGASVQAAYSNTAANVLRARKLAATGASRREVAATLCYTADQRDAMSAPIHGGQTNGPVSGGSDSQSDEEAAG